VTTLSQAADEIELVDWPTSPEEGRAILAAGKAFAGYVGGFKLLRAFVAEQFGDGCEVWYTERNGDPIGLVVPLGLDPARLPSRAMIYLTEQMLGAGMPPFPDGVPIADGRRHRYGKKSRAWYQLYLHRTAEGRELVFGVYGIWGQLGSEKNWPKITADFAGIDEAERERLQKHQKALADRERGKRDNLALYAARRALAQWKAARASCRRACAAPTSSAKASSTRTAPFATWWTAPARRSSSRWCAMTSARIRRMTRARRRGAWSACRRSFPDGSKRFNKGTAKAGASCLLGKQPKDGMPILFVEGVATGKSARMATRARLSGRRLLRRRQHHRGRAPIPRALSEIAIPVLRRR
jgi:hypothetical protein